MIECRNVTLSYGKKRIIDDISFTAGPGEVTVLLGRNGCGKTTLFRAIAGTLQYKGSITADGEEIRSMSAGNRARSLCIMPQLLHGPAITVRELVGFGRQPYTGLTGVLSQSDRQIIGDVLHRTGLENLSEKRLNCISGGERQKAYFAMILAQDTPNILLDEPDSHLDAAYSSSLMEFLKEEKKTGKTVLAVLHDINQAVNIADKLIVLGSGKVLFEGSTEQFNESNAAEEVFGRRKYICLDPGDPEKSGVCYL
ncbi:MAG: ABC transporter ATP-binding protein [Parasporobacterium sp.]|nr:ABC transporter ATP-binding protein [Parasporobacterium sp.]